MNFERVAFVYDRTVAHIKACICIQEYLSAELGFKVNYFHDISKFSNFEGYYYITLSYQNIDIDEDKKLLAQEAWKNHYMSESHHPNHYGDEAYKMTDNEIFEMVCDWLAMCYEFGEEDWTEFYRNIEHDEFKKHYGTDEQIALIERILDVAEVNQFDLTTLLKNTIQFPEPLNSRTKG